MAGLSSRLDPEFARLLRKHRVDELETHAGTIFGIWKDHRLAYVNPAWHRFALENGGEPAISSEWGLGRSILDSVPPRLRGVFEAEFRRCRDSAVVIEHEFECSSELMHRRFHQLVYPLEQGEGLLMVNSLLVEKPHAPAPKEMAEISVADYLDANGLITQCAFCRRVINSEGRWDLIREWIRTFPDNTSHGYCPTCAYHFLPMVTDPH